MRKLFFVFLMLFMAVSAFCQEVVAEAAPVVQPEVPIYMLIAGLVLVVLEYVLGKTKWVKANSTLELILNGISKFLKALGLKS